MRILFKKTNNQKGFTLIELMVSVSIFVLVMVLGMSSLLSINNSYKKSQTQKYIMDSLSFAMESMSREIRIGSDYYCGNEGAIGEKRDCTDGGISSFFFNAFGEKGYYRYYLDEGQIIRSIDGNPQPLTSRNLITINNLEFTVIGSESGDRKQPFVLISISGKSNIVDTSSEFVLQTAISQRELDS